jgi:hypothetical protein
LNGEQKRETGQLLNRVWAEHNRKKTSLITTQQQVIAAQRSAQFAATRERVSFAEARSQLQMEQEGRAPPRRAVSAPPRETDLDYVARVRADISTHLDRNLPKHPTFEKPQRSPIPPPSPQAPAAPAFERAAEPPPSPKPAPAAPSLSRSEQIKRDMEAWRNRNPGRDIGREL